MFNVFAGGAISRMAIFALGIMPYISSSIIVQLMTGVSEYFKNLKNQGESGRKKITQITRYGTVLLATIQGYGLAVGLESSGSLVINPGTFFKISTVTSIVAATIFFNVVRRANYTTRYRQWYISYNIFRYSCRNTKSTCNNFWIRKNWSTFYSNNNFNFRFTSRNNNVYCLYGKSTKENINKLS